jgi:hypothetical protein
MRYSRGCVEYATIVQYALVDAAVDPHWDPEWDSSIRLVGHFVVSWAVRQKHKVYKCLRYRHSVFYFTPHKA